MVQYWIQILVLTVHVPIYVFSGKSFSSSSTIFRRNYDTRDAGDSLRIREDMPGLQKQDLKIWVDPRTNTLFVFAEWWYDEEEETDGVEYKEQLNLDLFGMLGMVLKPDAIKAELKNGVLKIVIPKVKRSKPQCLNKSTKVQPARTPRRRWDVREDDDVLRFRVDLPGLGRENVEAYVVDGNLVVTGKWPYDEEEEASWMPFSQKIDLSLTGEEYKKEEMKVEMKDGVLKVFLPKSKT